MNKGEKLSPEQKAKYNEKLRETIQLKKAEAAERAERAARIRADQMRLREEEYRKHASREVVRDLGGGMKRITRGMCGGYFGTARKGRS